MIKKVKQKFDNQEWHKWFAWYPVYFYDMTGRFRVWFETIERRMVVSQFDWGYEYRFLDRQASKCYCSCGHEILQDEHSQFYDAGKHMNIICAKCGTQSSWDLDAPVPLFLSEIKSKCPRCNGTDINCRFGQMETSMCCDAVIVNDRCTDCKEMVK